MIDSYKNVLANKFMRDTNYIIIKDTDDIEELERQWELFKSSLTVRQQRLSDDRSIEIWNMTNQEHYEALKAALMPEIEPDNDTEDDKTIFDDDEYVDDDDISSMNFEIPDDEHDITEPIKEESESTGAGNNKIPITSVPSVISDKFKKAEYMFIRDPDKDKIADQYMIDSNINIIGTVKGYNVDDYLANLEKSFIAWNSQNQDHRKKSDDKCREIYGMSNIDRYKELKAHALEWKNTKTVTTVKPNADEKLVQAQHAEVLGEFVSEVYKNMQAINEEESKATKQHRRLNDTPYFTPEEMIDMGVHGNNNYYCPVADNDGLITNIKIPTWFDSYKDMCLDHIFEDYTKDWIDTLDHLYSDFEQIKESGDQNKILARKQSILDLGWNPEIPFTRRNRQLASKRLSKILDKTSPLNIFVKLDNEVPDDAITDTPVQENAQKNTHKPVYIVFVQGKSPIISSAIKKVTHSPFSHSGIAFDAKLDTVHTYNMVPQAGIVKETLQGYGDNIITVMAFFAPSEIYDSMKEYVMDFWINSKKTIYDFGIIFNKIIDKNARVVSNKYSQVCSTFVDAVLKSGNVVIDATSNVPSPAELYNSAKKMPNKIIEVYSGPANKYDPDKTQKKMDKLLEKGNTKAINEDTSITDLDSSESNDIYHNIDLWETGEANLLWVTGLSGSGKSTIAKDIVNEYKVEHVELDNLQRAKMDNWDETGSQLMDDYIASKGGLKNIFSYVNDLETVAWKDIVKNETECPKQFNDFFQYIINYANQHKNRRFVVEGVQIAMCSKDTMIKQMSKYPIIIKMNGPLKTEFRREVRNFKIGKEKGDSLLTILKKIAHRNKCWWQGKFYIDDWNELKYFKSHINEVTLPKDITLRNATQDDIDLIYKYEIQCVGKESRNDPKTIAYIKKDAKESVGYTKMIMYKDQVIGIFSIDTLEPGSDWKYIGDIFIEPEYRGMGIASSLIKEEISKHNKICLQVAKSNTKAIKLYKSLGFEITEDSEDGNSHVMRLDKTKKSVKEEVSLLNEVKAFPVEFDKEGNLIIYKCRIGTIAYGDEIDDSVKLLESYRNTNNIEGMKYELAKLWFINDSIEKKLKKRLTNDQYKELIDNRATCLNVFKLNLEYVMKAEQGFNFSDYYNSTPFSDNSIRITSDTLKYSMKALSVI
jgi:ribosomal protein S18 acetylase RimI-like enzyme